MESSSMRLLWDFTIQTDRHLSHNSPDIVCVSHQHSTAFLIDVAVPGDSRISQKINEKREKYTDLKIEIQQMWNMHAAVVPLCNQCPWIYPSVFGWKSTNFEHILQIIDL